MVVVTVNIRTKEEVAFSAVSTEHFVMCSNFAVDDDEIAFLRRALTELYSHTSFSWISDSYDYWNVVKNLLPKLHDEILAHDGCMLVRGDSDDCVKNVTQTVFELWKQFGVVGDRWKNRTALAYQPAQTRIFTGI